MEEPIKENVLITISRQMGSGGAYLGRRVANRLGFRYVDRDILKEATQYLGENEENITFREERVSGFLENLLKGFIYGSPETAYVPPSIRPVYDIDLYNAEARIIAGIADRDNAVIVGRAGFHVLEGRRGLASVFLHAPEDFRLRRVTEGYHMSIPEDAAALIRQSDVQRRRFIKTVAGVEWTDARCYHLSINTGAAGLAAAEDMILQLAEKVRNSMDG
ncbi:MAG: cytidylate kinase-like family protein [Candidatus Sulfobium sp.]|jgi:cytidylate kinase